VHAIVRIHQQSNSFGEKCCETSNNSGNEVDPCARPSHGVLAASSVVYDRNKTAWKYFSSSTVGRTSGDNVFADTAGVTKYRNCTYVQRMEALHARRAFHTDEIGSEKTSISMLA